MDSETVAMGLSESHMETSILAYNDENALSCVISLAYYSALENYSGKLLLVGINYSTKTKAHECVIEEYYKEP